MVYAFRYSLTKLSGPCSVLSGEGVHLWGREPMITVTFDGAVPGRRGLLLKKFLNHTRVW